jgi:hypothetical protein
VLDEVECLAAAEHEIVLCRSVAFEVTAQDSNATRITATYLTVRYPFPGRKDPKVIERIRDLEDRGGSVIAEISFDSGLRKN